MMDNSIFSNPRTIINTGKRCLGVKFAHWPLCRICLGFSSYLTSPIDMINMEVS